MTKRTQLLIDVGGNCEISTLDDGRIRSYFPVLDVEGIGSDEKEARRTLVQALSDKINSDEDLMKVFSEWAKDHVIEKEMTEEDIREEEAEKTLAKEASAAFVELTPENFDDAIGSAKPLLVDFWAPWCKPCLAAAPVLKAIHDEMADTFDVAKVNTEDHPEFSERFDIRGIPCFIVFRNGVEIDRIVGLAPKAEFRSRIDQILASS